MNDYEKSALETILKLNESDFSKLASLTFASEWSYVGSGGKNDGEDAHWVRYHNGFVNSITTSTYGDGKYYLIQETIFDLDTLQTVAESVIPFCDATESGKNNPKSEEGLAQIINNISHSLPAHGGDSVETIYNPSLIEKSEELNIPIGKELVNMLFLEIAARFDIPFSS